MSINPSRRYMSPPPTYESRRILQDATTLKPYLTLPYLLSLTWLAYPLLSLLFIAFRLQISSASAQDSVADAKGNLLTSCLAAEKAATAAASMPRYLAAASNSQIADAVNDTMNAARAALVLALTILEGVLNFVIDIYRSTFFCFLELVVQGGLSVLLGAVNEINSFLSSTFSGLRTSIQNDISSANSVITTAINGINKVNPFGNITPPQISVPSLDALSNVTLPSDFTNALLKLNSSLPTVTQVKQAIEDVLDTPFEDLKSNINQTFAGLNFDASVLPVPDQQTVSFCDQMDTSVVDDLGKDLLKVFQIGVILLIVVAFLILAGYSVIEWYKWRCLRNHLEYTRQAWVSDPTMQNAVRPGETPMLIMTDHNLLMLSASSQHPLITRIVNRLSAMLKLTQTKQIHLHWFFHYVFHPPALACFLIGFLGLLSVELQILAVRPLEHKFNAQVSASVDQFSNTIATSINASMFNQSSLYANAINTKVDAAQSTINDGLFGWVNGTTTTLNTTLNNFYTEVQDAVSFVFNGTVLENPMQQFVFCIIGTKVEALENALTFLHDNLVVNIPRVNESILVLSPGDVKEATQPIAQAAVGSGNGDSNGLVGKLVARYIESLKKERIMFSIFIGLWLLVVLMALAIIWWHSYGWMLFMSKEKRRQQQLRSDVDTFVVHNKQYDEARMDEKNVGSYGDPVPNPSSTAPRIAQFMNINLRSPKTRQTPPNAALQPPFERSWDSFIDASPERSASPSQHVETGSSSRPIIGAPRKLMAIGRKAMGRERYVSDEERARERSAKMETPDLEDEKSGWLSKLTSTFRGKKDEQDIIDKASVVSGSSTRSSRTKPKLTITTSIDFSTMARDQLPTAGGDAPACSPQAQAAPAMPGSAWSISPDAPTASFTKPVNTYGKHLSVRPTPRRNVSVPTSVNSVGDSSFPSSPIFPVTRERSGSFTQTPFSADLPSGVPSYYHSNLPHQQARGSVLPETLFARREHRRSSSVPLPVYNANARAKLATIHEPSMSSQGSKHKSQVADPFITPFDDDAMPPPMTAASNPFSPQQRIMY